jgi:hypothetical protein
MKPKTSPTSLPAGEIVGSKPISGAGTSEAEALRKDPLKNYVGLSLSVDFELGDE